MGRRDAHCSISLLTWSGRVSHDLHADEHVGVFSASRPYPTSSARPCRAHVLPGEHRYRGEHDYCADSDFLDRPSHEMVWSWHHTGAHAPFERGRVCRDWFRTGSHRACDVPDFTTGGRLRPPSTSARSSFHRVAARGQIQSQESDRHIRLPLWRSNRCVVLSVNAVVWLGTSRHFLDGSSAWSNLVRP